jgi:predicted RNA-binding protein YlxR (DUF448 family)
MSEPLRTCCACGLKTRKSNLLRFIWDGTTIVKDMRQTLSGRGAYSCKNEHCLQLFVQKKKKWKRLFRL